jgi:predicted DCC family thiol-disulfide oxidoreductase YuxK
MAPRSYPWTLIYDADCGFCKSLLARVLKLDRRRNIMPVALGTPEADERLADLVAPERAASWHLIAPDGTRYSAGST